MKLLSPLNKKKRKGQFSGENFSCFPRITQKKGVSLLVSYVLLITIAVALSILVYNWLRFYVQDDDVKECKEGISIVIQDYECLLPVGGEDGSLNLTLKNKGRFNVDGFILKVHDRERAELGLYTFSSNGSALITAELYNNLYAFSESKGNTSELEKITLIEAQPFVFENNEKTYCQKVSSQSVECQ